jgi:TPR repeat protein
MGKGVSKSTRNAARWLKQSAKGGDAQGCAEYGRALRLGSGASKNYVKAESYLRKSAECGNGDCYEQIASMD